MTKFGRRPLVFGAGISIVLAATTVLWPAVGAAALVAPLGFLGLYVVS